MLYMVMDDGVYVCMYGLLLLGVMVPFVLDKFVESI